LTWYVWEGGQVIAEYDAAAINWRKNYVYLGERLLAADSGGVQATQFYHPDRLGTRLVTNALDGSTAGEQESLPFGAELGAGAAGTRRFTSYDRSGATPLDYAVNRFYNQGLGRFTQVDPIGMGAASLTNPQSLNLYGYCENDPINHTDPEGLFFGFIIAAFIAIGTAAAVAARVIYNAIVKVVVVAKDGLGQLASGIKGFLSHGAGLSLGLDDEGDGGGPGIYWGRVIVAAAVVGAGAVSIYQAKKRPQLKRPPKGRQKPPNSSLGDSTFTLSEIFVLFLAFASAAVALQKPGCAEILGGLDKAQRLIKKARFRDANARNPRLSTFPQIVRDEVATGERGLAAISPVGGSNVYLTPLYFSGNTFVGKAVNLIHELKHLGGFTFEPDGYDYQTDYDEITSKCGFPRVIVRKKP
jgi:RHS repeat-associated protein